MAAAAQKSGWFNPLAPITYLVEGIAYVLSGLGYGAQKVASATAGAIYAINPFAARHVQETCAKSVTAEKTRRKRPEHLQVERKIYFDEQGKPYNKVTNLLTGEVTHEPIEVTGDSYQDLGV